MTNAEHPLTFGSLFAGIGGIDLGLERAGMKCVWQVENNEYATRVLEKHWPDVRRWGDVATFTPDTNGCQQRGREQPQRQPAQRDTNAARAGPEWQADLICGGFPCQPVSCAGKRKGESDERWLWDEMYRVCTILRPRWVLAENVPGLLSAGAVRGDLFGKVVRDLASLGYRVEWHCIPAAALGAPHIRDRVFILAHAKQFRCSGAHGNDQQRSERTAVASSTLQGSETRNGQSPQYNRQSSEGCGLRVSEVADTLRTGFAGNGEQGPIGAPRLATGESAEGRSFIPDAGSLRASTQWSTEPDVGRVAHGVPHRVDRLRCLGNAVVPQVAEWIGRRIMKATYPTGEPNV